MGNRIGLSLMGLALLALSTNSAWALGEELGESKEQLKLDYQVSVTDHGTGRVTVVLTITDEGRLKPLDSIDLLIPNETGTGNVNLSVSLAIKNEKGTQVVRVHLLKELADQAQIHLKTSHLDGKLVPLTWYYHVIPMEDDITKSELKQD